MGSIPDLWAKSESPTRDAAVAEAVQWVQAAPNRSYATVAATGSMKQSGIDENCLVLMEPCDGRNIKKGELVSYRIDDKLSNVLHRVDAIGDDAFIPNGTSNKHYDGWKPKSAIHHKVLKVIRFPAVADSTKMLASQTSQPQKQEQKKPTSPPTRPKQ